MCRLHPDARIIGRSFRDSYDFVGRKKLYITAHGNKGMCAIASADCQTLRTSPEQLADLLERYELPKKEGIHICLMACFAGYESLDGQESFASLFAQAMLLRDYHITITAHPTAICLTNTHTYACYRKTDHDIWLRSRTRESKLHIHVSP